VVIIEDLIKLLDNVSNTYRRNKYPDRREATKIAKVLRALADDYRTLTPRTQRALVADATGRVHTSSGAISA